MKLLSKTSISYLWLSFTVLIVMGIMLFFFLRTAVSAEIRERLELELAMVKAELRAGEPVISPMIEIDTVNKAELKLPPSFKDTLIYDAVQNEKEGYYYLKGHVLIKGQVLRIMVLNSYIGWDGYTQAISITFFAMACMLVIAGAFVNYRINRKIWSPFLFNLELLKSYSVTSQKELQLQHSDIDEFEGLNHVIFDLAKRARNEYVDLKEFTENVSHEIQTPLSIVKSRLENISQSAMDADLARYLLDAKEAVDRLSRVNRGLLLLAKLKNDQFEDSKLIDMAQVLKANIALMEDLFEQRNLKINEDIKPHQMYASPYLMEILVLNLLSNLRVHANINTEVFVKLDQHSMQFSNEGPPLAFPVEKLFHRFGKKFNGYTGTGLGLSIVKQICVINNWEINYCYRDDKHLFKIDFQRKNKDSTDN